MKIIQINGWCGRMNGPLVRFIKDHDPDIICLQEAFDPETNKLSVFKDQYDYTNEILKLNEYYHFFTAAWGFKLGNDTVDIGNMIISKFPISNCKHEYTNGEYVIRTHAGNHSNIRVIQSCTITTHDNLELSVANYQGYVNGADPIGNETTSKTLEIVKSHLGKLSKPFIFCADLNIDIKSPYLKILNELDLNNLTVQNKISSTLSNAHRAPEKDRNSVACDYIMASKNIDIHTFSVAEDLISDHKALVLDFDI